MKKALSLVLCLLLTLSLAAACGQKSETPSAPSTNTGTAQSETKTEPAPASNEVKLTKTVRLAIGGGNATSTGYMVCSGLASIASDSIENLYASVEAATGDIEETKLLNEDEIQMAVAMLDGSYYAYSGQGTYSTAYSNLRLFLVGPCSDLQCVTTVGSGINSITDLKGKRVGCGTPSSGCATIMVPGILEAYGLSYDDITPHYIGQADCADALADGTIDAAFLYTAYPSSAISELAFSKNIKMISLDKDKFDAMKANSEWFVYEAIPAGTYNGVNEDIYCVGVPTVLIVNAQMDDDVAYLLAKTMDEHQADWTAIHRSAAFYTPENTAAIGNSLLPLHPGVVKYLTEKGLKVAN